MSDADGVILTDISDAVGTVTISRPHKLNALSETMRGDLLDTLRRIDSDRSARVILITGAGRAFCAGGDIGHLHELKSRNDEAGFVRLLDQGRAVVRLLRASAKPTIAVVNGPAHGAGLLIAIACDLRFCSQSASFALPFVKLGLGPDWDGTFLLPRMIGRARTLEMLYTGAEVSAEEAHRIGLVNRVWPDGTLAGRAREFARSLAKRPPELLARYKDAVTCAMDLSRDATAEIERRHQLENFRSERFAEGLAAFLDKQGS